MRPMALILIALAALVTTPRLAASQKASAPGAGMAAVTPLWEQSKTLYLQSAAAIPEDKLGYRPTPDVRSFGEILGHVVNDSYYLCSSALGEKDPNGTNYEKVTTRAGLTAALKKVFTYCDRAYQMSEAKAMESVSVFNRKGNRLWVLMLNVYHNGEHYGNLVTYFRLNGMVPPSSRQQ